MHRADIRAELEKKGTSLAQLGIENGLSRTTVRNALDKPYPKGEWIIANALGLKPSECILIPIRSSCIVSWL